MKVILALFVFLVLSVQIAFAQWSPGEPFTDTRDGQVYRTVRIGTQVWMAENLNIGRYIASNRHGSLMRDNNVIEKYCWQNNEANCNGDGGVMKRGGFYEWPEALDYFDNLPAHPIQGICPDGWHVSSNNEWRTMTQHLGGAAAYLALIEGGAAGFDALFTGYRDDMNGGFRPGMLTDEPRAYFWTTDPWTGDRINATEIGPSGMKVLPFAREAGLCVRCVLDEGTTRVGDAAIPVELELHRLAVRPGRQLLMHFTATAGDARIIVSDVLGRIVHNSGMQPLQGENYHLIDLAHCAAGAYILRIQSAQGAAFRSFSIP
jgi:uncharacterized protein (TIGR02145 family)